MVKYCNRITLDVQKFINSAYGQNLLKKYKTDGKESIKLGKNIYSVEYLIGFNAPCKDNNFR